MDTVFAIRKLYLGNTDRSGAPSSSSWKKFGYNLDGKISTKTSTDLCQTALNASTSAIYEDGTNGIDNSFGKNILPIILGISSNAPLEINNAINTGKFTLLLDLKKLGSGTNYNPLATLLYGGSGLVDGSGAPAAPKWDGSDTWPVADESVSGGSLDNPTVQFPGAYLVKNSASGARTWVSGGQSTLVLNLVLQGATLSLSIHAAILSADIDASNQKATNGTIAGVLDTEELVTSITTVAPYLDPSLCPPSNSLASITDQIRQASDIMKDGSQDPSQTCSGISIGLGFDLQAVKLGPVAAPATIAKSSCTD